jgi:hypothetical protein
MTEPSEGLPKTKVGDTEITAHAARSFEQLDSLNANRFDPLPLSARDLPEPAPYVKERLFSRKVIIGWAAATLLVWFAISFIAPIVVETVRAEIESRMIPPTGNTAGQHPDVAPGHPVPAPPDAAPVVAPPAEPLAPVAPVQPVKPPAPKK